MEWELDSAGPLQYKPTTGWLKRNKLAGNDEEKTPVSADLRAAPVGFAGNGPNRSLSATESTFTWADLELNVEIGKETRKLLDGVCGYCKPGSLTALVGASGAGKSTRMSRLQLYSKRYKLTRFLLFFSSANCPYPTAKCRIFDRLSVYRRPAHRFNLQPTDRILSANGHSRRKQHHSRSF